MTFEMIENSHQAPLLKVVGVGGGGGNAVRHMINNKVEGVEFVCANTDSQALTDFKPGSTTILELGANVTKGLGAGANPELGRQAAIEDRDKITDLLDGADMVFITAGMGGGTGTGGAPVVAEVARELGVLTVAVVTKPFDFEGRRRTEVAEEGIKELGRHVDSLITIPNQRLPEVLGKEVSMLEAFNAANDVLLGAVKGIADLILKPGLINLDFADVRTVMREMGMAMMGTGGAKGAERARVAAEKAIRSPLLEDINLEGAKGVLVNITAGENFGLGELEEAGDIVRKFASEDATVLVGMVIDKSLDEDVRVTVVATGFRGRPEQRPTMVIDNKHDFDTPTVLRQPQQEGRARPAKANANAGGGKPKVKGVDKNADRSVNKGMAKAVNADLDFLDVPAFLRRQAD